MILIKILLLLLFIINQEKYIVKVPVGGLW